MRGISELQRSWCFLDMSIWKAIPWLAIEPGSRLHTLRISDGDQGSDSNTDHHRVSVYTLHLHDRTDVDVVCLCMMRLKPC